MVNMGSVVACQPTIDREHVEALRDTVPEVGDLEGLLNFCLPLQAGAPTPRGDLVYDKASNIVGWIDESPDIRIFPPTKVDPVAPGRALVGFTFGAGLRQMSVVSFGGRWMLNSGYHRAVALLLARHRRVPVVAVTARSQDDTPSALGEMFEIAITLGPNPPRVADFLGPSAIDVEAKRRRYMFSVRATRSEVA